MIPVSGFLPPPPPPIWWPCTHYTLLHWPCGGRLAALNVSWQKKNIELQAGTFGVWNTFSCRNKKPTPSTLIGSMMVIKVLPIRVPPCYEGGYLKPTPLKPHMTYDGHLADPSLKPHMTYDDHLVWPIHVPRRCDPHLSLWGNARTRSTFPIHEKKHNPHPQGKGGKNPLNLTW